MEVKVKAWLPAYLFSAWLGHFCQGLGMGILGPTQPYLAAQVKELIVVKAISWRSGGGAKPPDKLHLDWQSFWQLLSCCPCKLLLQVTIL